MFGHRKHGLQWQKHSSEHLHGYLSRTGIVTRVCRADQGYWNSNSDNGKPIKEQWGVTDQFQVKSLVPLDLGPQKTYKQSRKQPRRCWNTLTCLNSCLSLLAEGLGDLCWLRNQSYVHKSRWALTWTSLRKKGSTQAICALLYEI